MEVDWCRLRLHCLLLFEEGRACSEEGLRGAAAVECRPDPPGAKPCCLCPGATRGRAGGAGHAGQAATSCALRCAARLGHLPHCAAGDTPEAVEYRGMQNLLEAAKPHLGDRHGQVHGRGGAGRGGAGRGGAGRGGAWW